MNERRDELIWKALIKAEYESLPKLNAYGKDVRPCWATFPAVVLCEVWDSCWACWVSSGEADFYRGNDTLESDDFRALIKGSREMKAPISV